VREIAKPRITMKRQSYSLSTALVPVSVGLFASGCSADDLGQIEENATDCTGAHLDSNGTCRLSNGRFASARLERQGKGRAGQRRIPVKVAVARLVFSPLPSGLSAVPKTQGDRGSLEFSDVTSPKERSTRNQRTHTRVETRDQGR